MRNLAISILLAATLSSACSCTGNKNKENADQATYETTHVEISTDNATYNSLVQLFGHPAMVILEEDDNTMYANIDRLLYKNNKFFILDRYGYRTVVAFSGEGKPLTRFGTVGSGPGEYISPYDIAVKDQWVYILDQQSQKLLKFHESGEFIAEQKLPFIPDAIAILPDSKLMFNLMPDGIAGKSQICITDSTLTPLKQIIPQKKGYVGGWSTNDILRHYSDEILFYRAPTDTLFSLTDRGEIDRTIVFDFQDKGVSDLAKLNFIKADAQGEQDDYIMLANTPIPVGNDIWVGLLTNDDSQYTIIFDAANNKCGGKNFNASSSVFDMIEPMSGDGNGNVISVLDEDLATRCKDYESLDNNIKNAMKNGNRILMIHSITNNHQSDEK